jgi:hypothetical protein
LTVVHKLTESKFGIPKFGIPIEIWSSCLRGSVQLYLLQAEVRQFQIFVFQQRSNMARLSFKLKAQASTTVLHV